MFAKNLCCWLWPTIKKETKKKKKICERKGKLKKKKISLYRKKKPIPILIFDWLCITEINLIQSQKRRHFLTLKPTLTFWPYLGHFWPSWLNFGRVRSIFGLIQANFMLNYAGIWPIFLIIRKKKFSLLTNPK